MKQVCFIIIMNMILINLCFGEGINKKMNDIKKELTSIQYEVTQNCATEPPFDNKYWNYKEDGIYVDIISGEALFSSIDKFDSGSGWPSFVKTLKEENIVEKEDLKLGMKRIEVRSAKSDSHLGHLFEDGPKNRGGMRYCINSASLKFIPKNKFKESGYEEYLKLFKESK